MVKIYCIIKENLYTMNKPLNKIFKTNIVKKIFAFTSFSFIEQLS